LLQRLTTTLTYTDYVLQNRCILYRPASE